jgi:hypothetical protein
LLVPVRRELRERQATLDFPVIPAAQATLDFPVIPAAQATPDCQAFQVSTVPLVLLARRAHKVPKGPRDLLDRTVPPERPAQPTQ